MRRIITSFALIGLAIVCLFLAKQTLLLAKPSTTAAETMLSANRLYEMSQFAQAAHGYEQLIDQGFADSALFYNLGNAYFKQAEYGRAILNYRHAERLAPRDADIQANLGLARSQTVDQLEAASTRNNPIRQLAHLTQAWMTLNELGFVALGLWVLFAFLIVAFSSARRGSVLREGLSYALVVSGLALIMGLAGLGSRLYIEKTYPQAVVVAQEVDVTSGPGSQYVTEFTLHNGAEVDMLEAREHWVRLALPDGDLEGWVPASAVEAVVN